MYLISLFQCESEEFFSEFLELLKVCLIVGEKYPEVERTLSFVARFTTADKRLKESKEGKENGTGKENTQNTENCEDATEKGVDGQKDSMDCEPEGDRNKSPSSSSVHDESVTIMEEEEVDPFLINMFQFLLNVSWIKWQSCQ